MARKRRGHVRKRLSSKEDKTESGRAEGVAGVRVQDSKQAKKRHVAESEDVMSNIKAARAANDVDEEDSWESERGMSEDLLSHSQMIRSNVPRTLYNGQWYTGKNAQKATKLFSIQQGFGMPVQDLIEPSVQPKNRDGDLQDPLLWNHDTLKVLVHFVAKCTSRGQLNELLEDQVKQRTGRRKISRVSRVGIQPADVQAASAMLFSMRRETQSEVRCR